MSVGAFRWNKNVWCTPRAPPHNRFLWPAPKGLPRDCCVAKEPCCACNIVPCWPAWTSIHSALVMFQELLHQINPRIGADWIRTSSAPKKCAATINKHHSQLSFQCRCGFIFRGAAFVLHNSIINTGRPHESSSQRNSSGAFSRKANLIPHFVMNKCAPSKFTIELFFFLCTQDILYFSRMYKNWLSGAIPNASCESWKAHAYVCIVWESNRNMKDNSPQSKAGKEKNSGVEAQIYGTQQVGKQANNWEEIRCKWTYRALGNVDSADDQSSGYFLILAQDHSLTPQCTGDKSTCYSPF